MLPPILKAKYPAANYAPRANCEFCAGMGEKDGEHGKLPCLCIFVHPRFVDVAQRALGKLVSKESQIGQNP